jgi:UDP-N-acetylglucosamine 2-epimerase
VSDYFLVSAHREENIEPDDSFLKLVACLNKLAEEYGCPVVVSTHPRTRKRIDDLGIQFRENINLLRPLGFLDYVSLEMGAKAVLSDSGTITEESSILKFPALNLRETHERLEGMEEAVVMMVGLDWQRIRQGLDILMGEPAIRQAGIRSVPDYSVPNVSEKIVRLIHSYTDYVRRVVWRDY